MQHRFAYIGADLQDLYGVRPGHHHRGHRAAGQLLPRRHRRRADGHPGRRSRTRSWCSAETVTDYQLPPGDTVNLRLLDAGNHQPITVPFHYAGVVNEFPTAPKDSFFVANAAYVAATHRQRRGRRVPDRHRRPGHRARSPHGSQALLGPSATVTDIATTRPASGPA